MGCGLSIVEFVILLFSILPDDLQEAITEAGDALATSPSEHESKLLALTRLVFVALLGLLQGRHSSPRRFFEANLRFSHRITHLCIVRSNRRRPNPLSLTTVFHSLLG